MEDLKRHGFDRRNIDSHDYWLEVFDQLDARREGSSVVPPRQPHAPVLPLRHLYETMSHFYASGPQAHFVDAIVAAPNKLAGWFDQSVRVFGSYENRDEAPWGARKLSEPKEIADPRSDADVTEIFRSRNRGKGHVVDSPELDFVFVEREVVPERSTGVGRRGRRVDWLLRNATDNVPILAELKIDGDKEAFFALVQLLMYGAMFSTGPQHARLRKHVPALYLPTEDLDPASPIPRIDLYIVLVDHERLESKFTTNAMEVASQLVRDPHVGTKIRRIACLETKLATQPLAFRKVFSFDAPASFA